MRVKITCRLDKDGYVRKIELSKNGSDTSGALWLASRKMTGTVEESLENGIFSALDKGSAASSFTAFNKSREFVFSGLPAEAKAEDVWREIEARAKVVRAWVDELKGFDTQFETEI